MDATRSEVGRLQTRIGQVADARAATPRRPSRPVLTLGAFLALAALAALALAGTAAAAQLVNPGFESGTAGWTGSGTTYATSCCPAAAHGSLFGTVETTGNVGQYSSLSQDIFLSAGDTLQGDALFATYDAMPRNDYGDVRILLGGSPVATLFSASVSTVGPSGGYTGNSGWVHWTYTASLAGTYAVQGRVADVGSSGGRSFILLDGVEDNIPPVLTAAVVPGPNANGWNNGPVTVDFSCTDDGGVAVQPVDVVLTSDGVGLSASATCKDFAGNSASLTVGGISIDRTPPTLSATRAPLANANGWNNGPVTVSFACEDALSGVDAVASDHLFSSEGANQSVTGACSDNASNVASVALAGINIDLTPPEMTASRAPGPNANGWNNSPVTVAFACDDALSGVVSAGGEVTFASEGVDLSVGELCTDKAGNAAASAIGGINIDMTPPVVAATANCTVPGLNGWCRGDVDTDLQLSDALSGLGPTSCAIDGAASACSAATVTGEGPHQLSAQAQDLAGNTNAAVADFKIDSVAPTGAVTSPAVAPGGYAASWTAADGGSGVGAVAVEEEGLVGVLSGWATACDETIGALAMSSGDCARANAAGQYCYRVRVTDEAGNSFLGTGASLAQVRDDLPGLAHDLTTQCTVTLGLPSVAATGVAALPSEDVLLSAVDVARPGA